MGLFGRKKDQPQKKTQANQNAVHPLMPRKAYCSVCKQEQAFTSCWRRSSLVAKCPCCGAEFDNPEKIYARRQPTCPRCGEYLEHPHFEYGLCDGCGSKFELMEGSKPGLLPNRIQRTQMEQHGKSWSPE